MAAIYSIKKKDFNAEECNHLNIVVDEKLWYIECADCGEHLDPVHYLVRLANNEAIAHFKYQQLEHLSRKIQAKNKCKCEHCGKITKISK
jgi:uncharacterized Zn finger protein